MAVPGLPVQHTTTTTTAQTSKSGVNTIYLRSLPGILKVIEISLNFLGFICIEASHFSNHGRGIWFNIVALTGLVFTGVLFILYLFGIVEKYQHIPWLKIEFVFCVVWTGFYLIASSLAVTYANDAYIAAGIFGFSAMVVYGIDAFLKLMSILNSPSQ